MTTRISRMVGFSVPPTMAEELDRVAEEEHRTKSELFREMFRVYLTYRRLKRQQEDEERLDRLIRHPLEATSVFPMIETGSEEVLLESARFAGPRTKITGSQPAKDAAALAAAHNDAPIKLMT